MATTEGNAIPLPHRSRGRKGAPVVLLHGFGADHAGWGAIAGPLSRLRRTIAFDLPGHGAAHAWNPAPDARACAAAVAASLDALGIARAAFVGHSLGGAVAALVGLARPDLVERLVLLAPGGFGRQMNARLLRRYAVATDEEAIAVLLEQFLAPSAPLPDGLARLLAEARREEALRAAHAAVVEAITKGDGQGTLPLDALAAAPFPVALVWGLDDAVLPVRQAIDAPAVFARHLLPGVGHMPHVEAPDLVLRIVAQHVFGRLDG